MDGQFCGKCGAPAGSPSPAPGTQVSPIAAPLQDNVASALCYVLGFVTGIIFLVLEPYSKNPLIRFHAFQSIFGSVALFALEIVLGIVFPRYYWFGGFMGTISSLFWSLFELACIAAWLFMVVSAYQGKKIVLPGIGPFAVKQAQG
jgi:uncharacterized membrane protein